MAPPEPVVATSGPPPRASIDTPDTERPVRLTEISHSYAADGDRPYLRTGEILVLTVGFLANTASDDVVFSVELRDDESEVLMRTDTAIMGNTFSLPAGPGALEIQLKNVPMLDGEFTYCIGVQSRGVWTLILAGYIAAMVVQVPRPHRPTRWSAGRRSSPTWCRPSSSC